MTDRPCPMSSAGLLYHWCQELHDDHITDCTPPVRVLNFSGESWQLNQTKLSKMNFVPRLTNYLGRSLMPRHFLLLLANEMISVFFFGEVSQSASYQNMPIRHS